MLIIIDRSTTEQMIYRANTIQITQIPIEDYNFNFFHNKSAITSYFKILLHLCESSPKYNKKYEKIKELLHNIICLLNSPAIIQLMVYIILHTYSIISKLAMYLIANDSATPINVLKELAGNLAGNLDKDISTIAHQQIVRRFPDQMSEFEKMQLAVQGYLRITKQFQWDELAAQFINKNKN